MSRNFQDRQTALIVSVVYHLFLNALAMEKSRLAKQLCSTISNPVCTVCTVCTIGCTAVLYDFHTDRPTYIHAQSDNASHTIIHTNHKSYPGLIRA